MKFDELFLWLLRQDSEATCRQLARKVARALTTCPTCGAEPGCDIDCETCEVISSLDA